MSEAPSLPRVFGAVILPAFASIASIGFGLIEGEIRPVDSLLQWSSGTAMVIAQTDGDRKAWRYILPWMFCGVVDQIRRWMAVPQPVDTTQFTGWRTGIPSPISLFITFTPARISPTWAL